jgi:hypothetical protein
VQIIYAYMRIDLTLSPVLLGDLHFDLSFPESRLRC